MINVLFKNVLLSPDLSTISIPVCSLFFFFFYWFISLGVVTADLLFQPLRGHKLVFLMLDPVSDKYRGMCQDVEHETDFLLCVCVGRHKYEKRNNKRTYKILSLQINSEIYKFRSESVSTTE